MADQTARLEAATVKAENGSNILYRFSNDAEATADIPTESGDIPNLKKLIADIQAEGATAISIATNIFPTTAAGLAATTDQEYFLVASGDPDIIYTVYQNQAGSAVSTGKTAASSEAIFAAVDAATEAADNAQDSANEAVAATARFLPPATADYTTRSDGSSLQLGDSYFNTVMSAERIYGTSGWYTPNVDGQTIGPRVDALESDVSELQSDVTSLESSRTDLANQTDPTKGAAGVGFRGRTVAARLGDTYSAKDNPASPATLQAAITSNACVIFPEGSPATTLPSTYAALLEYEGPNAVMNVYQQSGETTRFAKRLMRGQTSSGSHLGLEYSVLGVEGVCTGSGASGPTNADYGLTLSLIKKDFPTTAVSGEIDGMNIVVRNGGPNSDTTCWLGNVSHYGQGFTAVFEASSSNVVSNITEHAIQIQAGIVNNREGQYIGYFTSANTGTLDDAFRCDHLPGASWTNFFRGIRDGVETFRVGSGGNIFLRGVTGLRKQIGVLNGNFRILNDAGNQELMTLNDSGDMTIFGNVSAGQYNVSGIKVVGPRDIGWVAMTGTGNKSTVYDTSSITLPQLASRVNAIQAALTTHGLIGA